MKIETAQAAHFQMLSDFLAEAGLPVSDLPATLENFVVAFDGGRLVASAGIEIFGKIGLLRSVAVAAERRGEGLGEAIFRAAVEVARPAGVAEIWLITNTADGFFEKYDFERVQRSAAPAAIAATAQFGGLCPSTAVLMRKIIA